jgi:hypothetical protein
MSLASLSMSFAATSRATGGATLSNRSEEKQMSSELVTFEKTLSGLRVRLTPEGRALLSLYDLELSKYRLPDFGDIIEYQLCNGWDWLHPEDIGALVGEEAPILSDDVTQDEHGNIVHVGDVFWYSEYQVHDPVIELQRHGEIYLERAGDDPYAKRG